MCTKISYTKRDAQTALNFLLSVRNFKCRREKRIYHCPDCNMWHLTSKEYYEEDEKTGKQKQR